MATYGKVGPFDEAEERWTQCTERLEQYFLANEVANAKKQRAIFLSVCGSQNIRTTNSRFTTAKETG
ncbi:Hypothetical predicted protein [Paramuricea clavata]|uniref:Uncharacterized protein n=1 Tax=Paramuricea clavata TaxID=317549 RepID=A0A7D9IJ23_PARCT|nr:Hypothetical predicted protein [Paramuricea clavata]